MLGSQATMHTLLNSQTTSRMRQRPNPARTHVGKTILAATRPMQLSACCKKVLSRRPADVPNMAEIYCDETTCRQSHTPCAQLDKIRNHTQMLCEPTLTSVVILHLRRLGHILLALLLSSRRPLSQYTALQRRAVKTEEQTRAVQ